MPLREANLPWPACPPVPLPADIQSPVGVLVVEVEEARKVPRMDFFTRSSPYVE